MGFGSPLGNLKGFALSRPPLVVFTLCLATFAITTLSLAYFVRNDDSIPNTDMRLDWKMFLKHLSGLELCVTPNETLAQHRVPNISRLMDDVDDSYGNISVAVTASLSLVHYFRSTQFHNVTNIAGILPLGDWSSICFSVMDSSLNVTFSIPQNVTISQDICVTFSGPRSLLPVTSSPPLCTPSYIGGGGVNARLESRPRVGEELGERVDDDWCSSGAVMKMDYSSNPDLNVLLTMRDRSLINLHLVHTSYFLFFMAITLVCYALIKGKHVKQKTSADKIPLDL